MRNNMNLKHKFFPQGIYRYADVMDIKQVQELLVNNQIDWLIHLSAILSATGRRLSKMLILFRFVIF